MFTPDDQFGHRFVPLPVECSNIPPPQNLAHLASIGWFSSGHAHQVQFSFSNRTSSVSHLQTHHPTLLEHLHLLVLHVQHHLNHHILHVPGYHLSFYLVHDHDIIDLNQQSAHHVILAVVAYPSLLLNSPPSHRPATGFTYMLRDGFYPYVSFCHIPHKLDWIGSLIHEEQHMPDGHPTIY